MTRFQKLAALTVATTLLLVTIGVVVRSTDAGLGCPDWPLCKGQLIPAFGDLKAWLEWIHRDIAAILGLLILGLPILAWRDHRDRTCGTRDPQSAAGKHHCSIAAARAR